MFNPLPFLALGAAAIGYSGAINQTDRVFESMPAPSVVAFSATPDLSVQDFVGKLPETMQDPLCEQRNVVAASLSDDFAETLEASWDRPQDINMELWTSDLMGTWTLLHVRGDGLACILSSGFGWTEGMGADDIVTDRPLS